MNYERLWVSVSGGRTSMMMARFIQLTLGVKGTELMFVFANSGEEHEKTLRFVDRCDKEWSLGVVWVESVTNPGKKSSTHKVVTFETASRKGEPFESMINKYGVPNKNYPHCTRELKLNPMRSYVASVCWSAVPVAVGIREDEPKRISSTAEAKGIVYPFAHWWPQDKQDVLSFWEKQSFDLDLEEREGNCKWCWKKTLTKHAANIAANPEWYEFPRRMEAVHGMTNRENEQVFFRGALSTNGLFEVVKGVSIRPTKTEDESGGCSESCEAFTNEDA